MKYLKFEHKKELRFGSRVSLRSHLVKFVLATGSGIIVCHKGKKMTLTPDDLRIKGVHNSKSLHTAMFSGRGIVVGQKYYLIDYTFKPDEKIKSEQLGLLKEK